MLDGVESCRSEIKEVNKSIKYLRNFTKNIVKSFNCPRQQIQVLVFFSPPSVCFSDELNKGFRSHAEDSWEARRFLLELFRIAGMSGGL